jgi:hypothetical protein
MHTQVVRLKGGIEELTLTTLGLRECDVMLELKDLVRTGIV